MNMDAKFTPGSARSSPTVVKKPLRLGHNYIGIEHILLGLIRDGDGNAVKILRRLEVDLDELRRMVEGSMEPASAMAPPDKDKITLVKQAEKMLKITFLEAKLFKSPNIDTEHLLLSMLKDEDNLATRTLNKFHVDYEQREERSGYHPGRRRSHRPHSTSQAQGPRPAERGRR